MHYEAREHPTIASALRKAGEIIGGWTHGTTDRSVDSPESVKERACLAVHVVGWPGVDLAESIATAILDAKWPEEWEAVIDDMLTDYAGRRERRETLGDVFQEFDAWVAAGGPWDDEAGEPALPRAGA